MLRVVRQSCMLLCVAFVIATALSRPVSGPVDLTTGGQAQVRALPTTFLCLISPQEDPNHSFNEDPGSRDNVTGERTVACTGIPEHQRGAHLARYLLFSENLALRQRKANGLFPFHSFW